MKASITHAGVAFKHNAQPKSEPELWRNISKFSESDQYLEELLPQREGYVLRRSGANKIKQKQNQYKIKTPINNRNY